MKNTTLQSALLLGLTCTSLVSAAHDDEDVETLVIYGHQQGLAGESIGASQGIIGQGEIASRPLQRVGDVLEFVPGMMVTQHSGTGKANQYFLRGFNLDHGTDFRTTLEGMPLNMVSHGHGQGYTDLNFIIPELIQSVTYTKGPYRAANSDFSTAGSAEFNLAQGLESSFVKVEAGRFNHKRIVAASFHSLEGGKVLFGLENHRYDGPWRDIEENSNKRNLMLRYLSDDDWSVTYLHYENNWRSADQIPLRAVESGLIDRFGSIDDSVGGEASRYSLSAQWQDDDSHANLFVIRSDLTLFSNFTYLLDDPILGDQFEQTDQRVILGGDWGQHAQFVVADTEVKADYGVQIRYDDIREVGLYSTEQRLRNDTLRQDELSQSSIGLYSEWTFALAENWEGFFGLRYDHMFADVNALRAVNSDSVDDGLLSIKAGLAVDLSDEVRMHLNAGQSFHSNDARGVTINQDPVSGDAVDGADFLVRGDGVEWGLTYQKPQAFNLSMALWYLSLDSELRFVGDAGNTEAGRPSERYGVEVSAYYWLSDSLSVDVEYSRTHSHFEGNVPGKGDHIEGSVPSVFSAGFSWRWDEAWQLSARYEHLGPRPLDGFSEVETGNFENVSAGLSYEVSDWLVRLDVFNLLDSNDHDIDYFYASRLTGEPEEGIEDIHFHPLEPRAVRLSVSYAF